MEQATVNTNSIDDDNNNNNILTTTLKLSLYSFPSQHSEPRGSESPPLRRTSASVPFLWEEVPGKPRQSSTVTTETEGEEITIKSLGLPPRLVKFTNTPSPTTVLDGPDVARSFSFRSPENRWRERGTGVGIAKFGSARWGSFRKGNNTFGGSFDISSAGIDETGIDVVWLSGLDGSQSEHYHNHAKKIKPRRSFFSLSSPNHNKNNNHHKPSHKLLASIYESFKHVVPLPWKRKQEKQRKMEA